MDGTKAPLGSWDGIIKDEQYGDRKLIDMDNRRIYNSNYCRTRAKCWMKQVFCTKWCLNRKVSFTKISPGLDGWRTYRDPTRPEIVPEKKIGSLTALTVEGRGVEGQHQESGKGNVGVIEDDESSTNEDIKAVRSFKFVLVEHIGDLLKPYWKQGNLSRDAYKIIMKKSVDKIIESIGASKVPKTESEQQRYVSASKTKIFQFVQDYLSILFPCCFTGPTSVQTLLIKCLKLSIPIDVDFLDVLAKICYRGLKCVINMMINCVANRESCYMGCNNWPY